MKVLLSILGLLLLLPLTIATVAILARRYGWDIEVQRKLLHTALGACALAFPWIFDAAWQVLLLCFIVTALLVGVRWLPAVRERIGSGLHGVSGLSYGEVYFILSIAILFTISVERLYLYLVPLAILTLCDAAAALIGLSYGRAGFMIANARRTLEGTAFFFLTAWLVALIVLLLHSDIARDHVILVAFVVAVFGALVEGASWEGLDNLFVPVCLYVLLDRTAEIAQPELITMSLVFLAALAVVDRIAARIGTGRNVLISMVTALYFFWIIGGWPNQIAPTAVFIAYLYLYRGHEQGALHLIAIAITTALIWYFVGRVLPGYDTSPLYTLSFSVHFAILLALQYRPWNWTGLALVALAGWCLVAVRFIAVPALTGHIGYEDYLIVAGSLPILWIPARVLQRYLPLYTTSGWLPQTLVVCLLTALAVPITLI